MAAVFTVLALAGYASTIGLRDHGVVVPGIVVKVDETAKHRYVLVSFTTSSGKHITTDIEDLDFTWSPKPRPGDRVPIRYDPDYPKNAGDARLRPSFHEVWGMAALAACSVVLAILAWMGRLRPPD
jgi:hypothetical protein